MNIKTTNRSGGNVEAAAGAETKDRVKITKEEKRRISQILVKAALENDKAKRKCTN